ncbi:DUF2619 domain-containing protein [Paenibacillus taiwanensis]|uniref:YqhV family protein n=1 Tax=Paenibacillus taiwanensis TaxID=401638 RepID=UPI00040BE333
MSFDKIVLSMAGLRFLSGSLELLAAVIMLRLNEPHKALAVNSMLALVGPIVLIATTTIGLIGIADKLSWGKFVWITIGVTCLLVGVLKK